MCEHTKEPWQIYTYSHQHWSIETAWKDGNIPKQIAGIRPGESSATLHILPIEEQEANASRIVACVNACAGLTTEQLERCGEGGVQALVEALESAVKALDYAARYYLLESAAAEMYAHCNGYADSPNAFAALAPFAGDTEGVE